jgi:hypothetical protein
MKIQIATQIGQPAAHQLIQDAMYAFTIGGNDYINNYPFQFLPELNNTPFLNTKTSLF